MAHEGQLSLFRYRGKPAYSSKDEIIRATEESYFENLIDLDYCCGVEPGRWTRSCKEYFLICPVCKKQTKTYRHLYQAMQAWNRGETNGENGKEKA
jgi:hypothetical protein